MRSCVLNHAQAAAPGRGLWAASLEKEACSQGIDVDRSRKSSQEMYNSFMQVSTQEQNR